MKQIAPITLWVNGTLKTAEFLDAYAIRVALDKDASFYWALFTKIVDEEGIASSGEQVAEGNLTMTHEEYLLWDQDEFAWDFVAAKLNITII